MPLDPYAPPAADIGAAPLSTATGGVSRDGKLLVIESDAGDLLPDHCIKCGEPAEGFRLRRKLQWHPRWVYFLLLFNVIFYAIGAFATRKTMDVAVPLCDQHRSNRSTLIWGSVAFMVLSTVMCGGGIALDNDASPFVALIAGTLGFVALIVLLVSQSPLRAHLISVEGGRFLGAKDAFLDRLSQG